MKRGRPRDLYDVINLFRNDNLPASAVIQDILSQKCGYKGISIPNLDGMEIYRDEMAQNWEPMLAHINFQNCLTWIRTGIVCLLFLIGWMVLIHRKNWPLTTISGEGQAYQRSYGHLGLRTLNGKSLEIIRFAAGNRLCVNLDYTDNNGRRSSRVVEPYSLRQAQNGNVLLYGVRAEDGKIRSYKIDQINDASITNRVFVPKHLVELSPSGISVSIAQRAHEARLDLSSQGKTARLTIPCYSLKQIAGAVKNDKS